MNLRGLAALFGVPQPAYDGLGALGVNRPPLGLALPPGAKLDREMSYDGSHPRQQEQTARDAFRSYGPELLKDVFIPGYGAGGDAKAASEAFGEGRYGAAAGNALMAAVDFVPGLGALAAIPGAAAKGIRAYHGSPHDFDRFDMSKIGTGEGAQAYGHGLYFAESEGVAKAYRDSLSGDNVEARNFFMGGSVHPDIDAVSAASKDAIRAAAKIHPDNVTRIARDIEDWIMAGKKPETFLRYNEPPAGYEAAYAAALEPWKGITYRKNKGSMYEVNIDADPADFLDWDAPLAGQSPSVQRAYRSVVPNAGGMTSGPRFLSEAYPSNATPFTSAADRAQAAATDRLRDAGIPGIKYLDAGSRGAGDGSRNYVVFDDRLITILRKYGIGALMTGGAGYGLTQAEYAQAEELLAQDGMNTGAR